MLPPCDAAAQLLTITRHKKTQPITSENARSHPPNQLTWQCSNLPPKLPQNDAQLCKTQYDVWIKWCRICNWWQYRNSMSPYVMQWRIYDNDAQRKAYYAWQDHHIRWFSLQQCTILALREWRTSNSTSMIHDSFGLRSSTRLGLRSRTRLPSLRSVSREWWWLASTSSRTSRNTMTKIFCVYYVFFRSLQVLSHSSSFVCVFCIFLERTVLYRL